MDTLAFTELLINWYTKNERNLPWRETSDPYKIWLSEVILQQTRIQQGIPYYYKFIENYPSIYDLANSSEQEVLLNWQGLGYYSRARNLLKCAAEIVAKYDGKFPNSYIELRHLPGIGPYTAAAISSIAFNQKVPAIDGNVYRVLSRIFDISLDITFGKGKKVFHNLAESLIPEHNPGIFNQALMEFGALQCTPKNPSCDLCPFHTHCQSRIKGNQLERPVKQKKPEKKIRNFNYYVFDYKGKIYMNKRSSGDIWQGLYDFYLVEPHNKLYSEPQEWYYNKNNSIVNVLDLTHKLTHQTIYARFHAIKLHTRQDFQNISKLGNGKFYSLEEVMNLPKPVLIHKFLKANIF